MSSSKSAARVREASGYSSGDEQQQQHQEPPSSYDERSDGNSPTEEVELRRRRQQQQQQQQDAYDSVSTILEVDSEESEASGRFRNHGPATRKVHHFGAKRVSGQLQAESEDRSMSPIAVSGHKDGNFSGALSALAQQVERLAASRDKAAEAAGGSRQAAAAAAAAAVPMKSRLRGDEEDSSTGGDSVNGSEESNEPEEEEEESLADERARSRPQSAAESLMMIAVSPMVSPRIRWPLARQEPTGGRQLVEVSNKSTMTSIDFNLMNRMVEKYFVERLDKASQSIAFDCEESGDTRGFKQSSRQTAAAAAGAGASPLVRPKVPTKSVAVGTETFSRERFSALPPTKTRSTQTKSNVDNDIGASETRRFKLSHLDLGSLKRRTTTTGGGGGGRETTDANSPKQDSPTAIGSDDRGDHHKRPPIGGGSHKMADLATVGPAVATSSASPGEPTQSVAPSQESSIKGVNSSESESGSTSGSAGSNESGESDKSGGGEFAHDRPQRAPAPAVMRPAKNPPAAGGELLREKYSQQREENKGSSKLASHPEIIFANIDGVAQLIGAAKVSESFELLEGDQKDQSSDSSNKQENGKNLGLFGNLKTELRVIIELSDLRQKQRSELTSNSQLVDGKLSKQTEINTSKHVAIATAQASSPSPREVYRRLELAGREHSLMFNSKSTDKQPIDMESSPLRVASSMSSLAKASEISWRQVSKSRVSNEIEANTNRSWRKTRPKVAPSATSINESHNRKLLMGTEARIRHLHGGKSALELRSRAARSYERVHRDPQTGQHVGSGTFVERTLVEGGAAFNENELLNGQAVEDNRARKPPLVEGARSSRLPPSSANLAATSHRQTKPMQVEKNSLSERPELRKTEINARSHNTKRMARLEIEEETEDRRQVTRNGRLVFDDRLNERRYETHRAAAANLIDGPGQRGGGILRNRHVQSPIQQQQQQQQQSADTTSNLSSDPETLDSGIAPSGAGSSNALNQQQQQQQRPVVSPTRLVTSGQQREPQRPPDGESTGSLTFVDEDEIDELAANRSKSVGQNPKARPAGETVEQQQDRLGDRMILPPAEFRNEPTVDQNSNTELVTRLTRSRQQQKLELTKRATQTRFEQNLTAPKRPQSTDRSSSRGGQLNQPLCKLVKAQVMFESDTDTSTGLERQQKELLSETKYFNSGGGAWQRTYSPLNEVELDKDVESNPKDVKHLTSPGKLANRMDYSLRVLRMRGSQIDSKVNTYIEHSRQPLISSQAS